MLENDGRGPGGRTRHGLHPIRDCASNIAIGVDVDSAVDVDGVYGQV